MSRNYFMRLEARSTSAELAPGLAARMYDPAWTLGRQWQVGEFLGDDAGTPVAVELEASAAQLAWYRPGDGGWTSYDPAARPLDALVEPDAERSAGAWTARLRVDTGRAFVRALADAGVAGHAAAFATAYRLDGPPDADRAADPAAARLLDVSAGRVPDGRLLYTAFADILRAHETIPLPDTVPDGDAGAVRDAAAAWLAWCDATSVEPAGAAAWDDEELAYRFSVATGRQDAVLDAAGHPGGDLDWYSFSARPVSGTPSFTALPPSSTRPTGVRFRGMPNARWWEMEDGSVDLGSVDAGPSDVARLAVLEFSLIYGNDFFAVPLRLPVGSLCRIDRLVVADSFGMRLRIEPAAHGAAQQGAARQGAARWTMFTLTERDPGEPGTAGLSDLLLLPPVARHVLTGKPVEEVLLLRDEMADLAWAVEQSYEGGTGAGLPRAEQEERPEPPPPPPAGAVLRYQLGTEVPSYWFPLVPQRSAGDLRLVLQRMANQDLSVRPRGRFLTLGGPSIADGEVPREGLRLHRERVLSRWSDGTALLWSRRLRRVGRGEGSSGLRFDTAITPVDAS